MSDARAQLSLWVPPPVASAIDAVRQVVDPVQARLIPAHVTLCRDEELDALAPEDVRAHLAASPWRGALSLRFGPAERFGEHGILLPCAAGEDAFRALRAAALGAAPAREQRPHLTLAHPRNPRAPGNALDAAAALPVPMEVRFTEVHWIEQHDGDAWSVRASFALEGVRDGRSPDGAAHG